MSQSRKLIEQVDGDWVFGKGKFVDFKLSDVAKDNPSYLIWVHKDATNNLSNDAYYALEDVMEEFNIEPA